MTPAAIFVFCLVLCILLAAAFFAGRALGTELQERRYAEQARENLALAVRDAQ